MLETKTVEGLPPRNPLFDVLTYLSISLCTVVVLIAAVLSVHPLSKQKTDRVSFRIMVYALGANVMHLISMLTSNYISNQAMCRVVGSVVITGLHLTSFLFFCIGLNLQLVMIHGIDGTKAEKYYVGGSLSLAALLGVVLFMSRQMFYDPVQKACYYHNPDPVQGLWWQIGIQHFWNFLTMAGEIIAFTRIIIYMARLKVFESSPSQEASVNLGVSVSPQYRQPIGPKQYRKVVLRIALYPLSSLATLGALSIGISYITFKGIKSQSDINFLSALRIILVFRGAIYGLIAATDPAITRGVKVLCKHYFGREPTSDGPGAVVIPSDVREPSLVDLDELESKGETFTIVSGPGCDEVRSNSFVVPSLPSTPKPVVLPPLPDRHADFVEDVESGIKHLYPELRRS
ncbi:hypothetical protein L218DRAFT_955862 [Marasmius fiardii PR-910]|nr:hypothetical protein L218DRAFT_955862 [Marasmius fiardii PR-910]